MNYSIRIVSIFTVALCGQACGGPSPEILDCEEVNTLLTGLAYSSRSKAPDVDNKVCAEWIEASSTRCQQAFRQLAQCSRYYNSEPDIQSLECASEMVEVDGSCVALEQSLSSRGKSQTSTRRSDAGRYAIANGLEEDI